MDHDVYLQSKGSYSGGLEDPNYSPIATFYFDKYKVKYFFLKLKKYNLYSPIKKTCITKIVIPYNKSLLMYVITL